MIFPFYCVERPFVEENRHLVEAPCYRVEADKRCFVMQASSGLVTSGMSTPRAVARAI